MDCTPEQASEGMAIVRVLAAVLERLVSANSPSTNPTSSHEVTKFHALKAPGISVLQYLERIHKYASCSTECFILALIYIDRLIQRNSFILSELNVHRVVITAVLLAAKFFDDAYYNNAYYAKVGGVQISEMNSLEVEFLFRINFSLYVTPEVFHKYNAELLSHAGVGADLPLQQLHQNLLQNNNSHPQQDNISFAPKAPCYPLNNDATKSSLSSVVGANTTNPCSTAPRIEDDPSRRITPSPPAVYPRCSVESIQKQTSLNNTTQMCHRDYTNESLRGTAVSAAPVSTSQLDHKDHSTNTFTSQTNNFTTVHNQQPHSSVQGLQQNVSQPIYSSTENTSNSIMNTNNNGLPFAATGQQQVDSHFSRNRQQIPVISHNHYTQYANNNSITANQPHQQTAPHLLVGGCNRLTHTEVSSYFHHHNDLTNTNNFLSTSPRLVGPGLAQAIRP